MELIEREAALQILHENPMGTWRGTPVYSAEIKAAIQEIEDLPTINAAPVRHGRWIYNTERNKWVCDKCNASAMPNRVQFEQYNTKFCPNCGARMDGGEGHEAD